MWHTTSYRYGKKRVCFQRGLDEEWEEKLDRKGKDEYLSVEIGTVKRKKNLRNQQSTVCRSEVGGGGGEALCQVYSSQATKGRNDNEENIFPPMKEEEAPTWVVGQR